MYKKNKQTLYIKTSNPSLFIGMSRNTKYWILSGETNNVEQIKKSNKNILKKAKEGIIKFQTGIKTIKESVTKSYKYIGKQFEDEIHIITFNADAWKNVAQNQTRLF